VGVPVHVGPAQPRRRVTRGSTGKQTVVGTEVAACLSLHLAHLTPAASSTFKHAASMPNPKFYELQRLRKSTWDTPRFVRGYGITLDNHLILPAVCAHHRRIRRVGRIAPGRHRPTQPRPRGRPDVHSRTQHQAGRRGQRNSRPRRLPTSASDQPHPERLSVSTPAGQFIKQLVAGPSPKPEHRRVTAQQPGRGIAQPRPREQLTSPSPTPRYIDRRQRVATEEDHS